MDLLVVTLVISALDAHFAVHTIRLANSLQAANEQLRNIYLFDNLTGLPNRLLLEDRMGQALAHAERSGKPIALLFVDLYKFKPVNDSFGHRVGDELLKVVAQRLKNSFRKEDTVARTGADEFLVVLYQLENTKDATVIGNKILGELSRPFHIEGNRLDISCSIGISVYPQDGKDLKSHPLPRACTGPRVESIPRTAPDRATRRQGS
jgi:diguanylate cyclase (GGDEF)-like protein